MTVVIDRLLAAVNAHDGHGAASLFHQDYRSEQPAHPGRAFVGREQMRANWEAMFTGYPTFGPRSFGRWTMGIAPGVSGSGPAAAPTGSRSRCAG